MNDLEIFDALREHIAKQIPGFNIGYKNENFISKLLGVLAWPFNRQYMTRFTTTRFPDVLFPNRAFVEKSPRSAWKILAHEYMHLWDRLNRGPLFNVDYALPQLLAVFAFVALLAIWLGPWGLFGLVPLIALAPWPSPGRKNIELRGYKMSMAVNGWRYGDVRESTKEWIVEQFTSSSYYFMWPFAKSIATALDDAELAIKNGDILKGEDAQPFREVHEILQTAGWVD